MFRKKVKKEMPVEEFSGKIEGWLAFYVVGLVISFGFAIYNFIVFLSYHASDYASNVQGSINNYIIFGRLFFASLILLSIIMAFLIFRKNSQTRKLAIWLQVLIIVGGGGLYSLENEIIKSSGGDVSTSTNYVGAGAVIWLLYWIFSKRVKATFTTDNKPIKTKTTSVQKLETDKKQPVATRRLGKKLIIAAASLLLILGVLTLADFLNYKHGGRSHLFGTIDTYSQKQTLHIYNLDLRVTGVKLTPYDSAKLISDEQECLRKSDAQPNPYHFTNYLCTLGDKPENNATDFANKYQKIEVNFAYNNISDQPIKFNTTNYDLLANTTLYNFFRECDYQWSENLIKGSQQTSCIRADISKTYTGPVNLEIKLYGKSKRILVNL